MIIMCEVEFPLTLPGSSECVYAYSGRDVVRNVPIIEHMPGSCQKK